MSEPKAKDAIAEALADENRTPEQRAALLRAFERLQKRRRIYLAAYLLALTIAVTGLVATLVIYGRAQRGAFVAWIFLVPMGLIGAVFWLFGRWAKRV